MPVHEAVAQQACSGIVVQLVVGRAYPSLINYELLRGEFKQVRFDWLCNAYDFGFHFVVFRIKDKGVPH